MRVTFLLPRYGWTPSGGFSVVYRYAGVLVQRGHEVTVVHPRRLPPGGWSLPTTLHGKLHYAGGRMRDRFMRPSLRWAEPDARIRMAYVPEISADNVPDADAVIATWWATAEAALNLPRSKGQLFHLVQGYETWNGAEERIHAVWRAPVPKVFISTWLMERVVETGSPRAWGTVIPNGVDHDRFRILEPIADRPPRVAMLYSSARYKGGDVGVEILRRVREDVPDMSGILFGVERAPPGLPSWIEYVRAATAPQLAQTVYNKSAVYLCPSLSEGWHLPATEAMACGCALVSSDIGGVRDYAKDAYTALLFPAGDAASGARRITSLLNDELRREALAQRGAEAVRDYSWERSGARLEALLEEHAA